MSTSELKQLIIESLQQANDIAAMQHVQQLVDELKTELNKTTLKPLTVEEYEARIKLGMDEIERGEGIPFDDFEKEMDSW